MKIIFWFLAFSDICCSAFALSHSTTSGCWLCNIFAFSSIIFISFIPFTSSFSHTLKALTNADLLYDLFNSALIGHLAFSISFITCINTNHHAASLNFCWLSSDHPPSANNVIFARPSIASHDTSIVASNKVSYIGHTIGSSVLIWNVSHPFPIMYASNSILTLSDSMFTTLSLDGSATANCRSYSASVACCVNDLNVSRYLFANHLLLFVASISSPSLLYHFPSSARYAFHRYRSVTKFAPPD